MIIEYKNLNLYGNPEYIYFNQDDEDEYQIKDEDSVEISDIYYFYNKNENEIKKILKEILVERNIKINWMEIIEKIMQIENTQNEISSTNFKTNIKPSALISFLLNKNEDEKFEKIKNIFSFDLYFENSRFNIKIKGNIESNIKPEIEKVATSIGMAFNPLLTISAGAVLKSTNSDIFPNINKIIEDYIIAYNDRNKINEIMNNIFEKIKKMAKSLNKDDLNELTDFFDDSIDSDDLKNEEKLENALL